MKLLILKNILYYVIILPDKIYINHFQIIKVIANMILIIYPYVLFVLLTVLFVVLGVVEEIQAVHDEELELQEYVPTELE